MKGLGLLLLSTALAVPAWCQLPPFPTTLDVKQAAAPEAPAAADAGLTQEQLESVQQAARDIRENYVAPVGRIQLEYGAIKGMARTLDPHSKFFTPQEYADFKKNINGEAGPDLYVERRDDGIAYVHVASFNLREDDKFLKAIAPLQQQGLAGIVVDLRGNPGGFVNAVEPMCAMFLKQGDLIVSVRTRLGPPEPAKARFTGPFQTLPLAVLVDGGSASASEIFAGAMQDHRRGVIVGEKTYGKGTVQQLYEYPDGSALKLTIARYFTPSGRSVDKVGITPDVKVTLSKKEKDRVADMRDRQLRGEKVEGTDPALDAAIQALKQGQ